MFGDTLFGSFQNYFGVIALFMLCLVIVEVVASSFTIGGRWSRWFFAPTLFKGVLTIPFFRNINNIFNINLPDISLSW